MNINVHAGDCLEVMRRMREDGVQFDSACVDPPYHLASIVKRFGADDAAPAQVGATGAYARASRGFMGQTWDGGDIAFRPETWRLVFDLLKPGGHLIAFSATKNYHRMAVAIEDAGFEIRDMLGWLYGTGFPKNHDMSKALDRHLGVERPVVGTERLSNDIRGGGMLDAKHGDRPGFERNVTVSGSDEAREWEGWGTALKPAQEPICLARKPLSEGSVAANLLAHRTGALNIDGCRVPTDETLSIGSGGMPRHSAEGDPRPGNPAPASGLGRYPANIMHDGSDEVVGIFPEDVGADGPVTVPTFHGNSGSAARFFYTAKATRHDRLATKHPTVKPVELMRWCVRLITPPGGRILDCFAGTGTTGAAAFLEGFAADLIELNPDYLADIERRLAFMRGEGRHSHLEKVDLTDPRRLAKATGSDLPLFK